jgi:serine kinase of HPr protein (carbohydrate metabolism regulator)
MSPPARSRTGNRHCNVVEIAGKGILIEGPAGSGKTSLALGLVDAARQRGIDAHFVADDQALLTIEDGRVIASTPPPIAGLAEIRGHGIVRLAHRPQTSIELVIAMVNDDGIERMPAKATTEVLGTELPAIAVPVRHEAQAIRIILASLGISLV